MRLQVALTIDVEFTIGGAFADPHGKRPVGAQSVECRIGDEGAGLDFIMDTLEQHGLRGVFFVEVLNTLYFGDAPMGGIARRIHARGHDVEFHAHPCWTAFTDSEWAQRAPGNPPCDSLAELETAEIARVLEAGLGVFSRWGLPAPCAFRAGNLQSDLRIYPLLERYGIALASNVGLGTSHPQEAPLQLAGGRHRFGGTLEIPVSSYVDVRLPGVRRWKTFTVIGTGVAEARQWLDNAARLGVGPVVILTHPSEFVHSSSDDYLHLSRNELSRRRFESLCAYLAANAQDFEVVTFADSAKAWSAAQATHNPQWHASMWSRVLRVVENRAGSRRHAA